MREGQKRTIKESISLGLSSICEGVALGPLFLWLLLHLTIWWMAESNKVVCESEDSHDVCL